MGKERRLIVVTGACSGIGLATALKFSEEGNQVIGIDISGSLSDRLQGIPLICSDLSIDKNCKDVIKQITLRYGIPDVLVNNAGITTRSTITDTDPEVWDKIINVNLRSVYSMCRHLIPLMERRQSGTIVNVASGWGLVGGAAAAAYCASKGAVIQLTRAMAIDHGPNGIRVNCVCPGDTDTPMLKQESEELGLKEDALLLQAVERPLRRVGKPNEIADAIYYLSSQSASFITGTALVVDGGGLAGSS